MTDLVRSSRQSALLVPTRRDYCSRRQPLTLSPVVATFSPTIHASRRRFRRPLFPAFALRELEPRGGIVKSGSFSIDRGVGVRAVVGEKQAFAYSDDISPRCADAGRDRPRARSAGRASPRRRAARPDRRRARALRRLDDPIARVADEAQKSRCSSGSERHGASARPAVDAGDGVARRRVRGDPHRAQRRRRSPRTFVRSSACHSTVIVEENGRREQGMPAAAGASTTATSTDALLESYVGAGGRSGADQSRRAPCARRHDDGGARPRLARHPAARGDRPRSRRRFQPQGRRARSPGGSASASRRSGITVVDDGTIDRPPRLAQRRRRRQSDAAHGADRGWHPAAATCRIG